MKQELSMIHLGPGNVGSVFIKQVTKQKALLAKRYGVTVSFTGIFNSKNSDQAMPLLKSAKPPFVIVDTTASDTTDQLLYYALKKGGYAILSNKKPLSSDQRIFDKLYRYKNRLFFETTVAAGLPVISTLKELLETGDEILEIQGCFSGTLGYIFSELEHNKTFSDVIIKAMESGFTEPDPRDDLSGIDVLRKAIILKRILGSKIERSHVSLQSLVPKTLLQISVANFIKKITIENERYKKMISDAKKNGNTIRFVATISKNITIGLKKVIKESDLGRLSGPDNIVIIRSKRYNNNPLIIKGPGAGIEVTAGGVVGDLIKMIKIVSKKI